MRQAIALVALAAAFAAAGCSPSEEAPPADPARARLEKVLAAVRAETGAQAHGDVLWYGPDNLYDYINGQAEEYLAAGFERLVHSEWKAASGTGDGYVEIDLYDMASPKGVAAVLVPPPADKATELAPGVAAYLDAGMCEFGAGRYYVRLTARRDVEGQGPLVDALAKAVAKAVSTPGP